MSEASVTAVIPLYNKKEYIERAIRSALSQSSPVDEVIVVDDGSTDGGASIVERITDPRITLTKRENGGVSKARNDGIRAARSELVAFLDADDEWKPGFIEAIRELRSDYPDAGIYSTGYTIVEASGRRIEPPYYSLKADFCGLIPNFFKASYGWSPVWTSATVVPKAILGEAGLFREGARRGEDLDLWFRIALKSKVAFDGRRFADYRMDAENRSAVHAATEDSREDWWFLSELESLVSDRRIDGTSRRWINETIASFKLKDIIEMNGTCILAMAVEGRRWWGTKSFARAMKMACGRRIRKMIRN